MKIMLRGRRNHKGLLVDITDWLGRAAVSRSGYQKRWQDLQRLAADLQHRKDT